MITVNKLIPQGRGLAAVLLKRAGREDRQGGVPGLQGVGHGGLDHRILEKAAHVR